MGDSRGGYFLSIFVTKSIFDHHRDPDEIISRRINFTGCRHREGYRVITVNRRSIVRRYIDMFSNSIDLSIQRSIDPVRNVAPADHLTS